MAANGTADGTADGTAYDLGIDLGTTYVAAGILEHGRPEIITLGDRAPVLPSVLYFKEDGEVLTGESAARRGLSDPTRVVREFKRRVGDTTPVVVGQTPYPVDVLMAKLMRFVHDVVVERQGAAPRSVAVTHPANWGPYKIDVLEQAVRIADIGEVTTITEPVAAAIHYAAAERLQPGETVAVYDLGGGTFDAAVLRKTDHDFTVLGEVEGIERLGGIDFDEAVFQHVVRFCESSLAELDVDDPAAVQALARLRQECVAAKEVLSTDTDVTIPVVLPNLQSEVRLTRAEFEAMIRPLLQQTVEALHRAVRSAEVDPQELSAVLLVGGSSRIPLIAEMVGAELGRPIAVDRHPKHTVALGAAISAGRSDQAPEPRVDDWFRTDPTTAVPAQAGPTPGQVAAVAAGAAAVAGADDLASMFPLQEDEPASPPSADATSAPLTGAPAAFATETVSPADASSAPSTGAPAAFATETVLSPAEMIGTAPMALPTQPTPLPAEMPAAAAGTGPAQLAFSSTGPADGPELGGAGGPKFQEHQFRAPGQPTGSGGRIPVLAGLTIALLLLLGGTAWAFARGDSGGDVEPTGDQTGERGDESDPAAAGAVLPGEPADPGTVQGAVGQQGNGAQGAMPPTSTTTGRTETTAGGTSTTAGRTSTTGHATTTHHRTTTSHAASTTTAPSTTTTTASTTTTTATSTTTSTTAVESETIRIVSGPRVNSRSDTSFQFNYSTNDVCGTGSFTVTEKASGRSVGSFRGDDICFGPLHGGHPNGGSPAFAGFDLHPGTTYRVTVTVRGTASDGTKPAGHGSDSATFDVTTTG